MKNNQESSSINYDDIPLYLRRINPDSTSQKFSTGSTIPESEELQLILEESKESSALLAKHLGLENTPLDTSYQDINPANISKKTIINL